MKCVNHPNNDATAQCSVCKDLLCDECRIEFDSGKYICKTCAAKINVSTTVPKPAEQSEISPKERYIVNYTDNPNTSADHKQPESHSEKNKGGFGCALFVIAALCILFLPIISGILDSGNSKTSYKPSSTTHSTTSKSYTASKTYTTTKSYETEDPLAGLDYYGPDTYKVGVDIPADEYMVLQYYDNRSGYMCVSSDSNGNDILDNAVFYNYHFIKVSSGQYFELTNAIALPASKYKIPDVDTSKLIEGMYRVGVDIPAGEYKVSASSSSRSGYYAIYNTASADRDIEDNELFSTSSYVTVTKGQYLELSACTASLVD